MYWLPTPAKLSAKASAAATSGMMPLPVRERTFCELGVNVLSQIACLRLRSHPIHVLAGWEPSFLPRGTELVGCKNKVLVKLFQKLVVSKGKAFGRTPQRSKYFYRSSAFCRENQQGNFVLLIGELFAREKVPGRLAVVYKPTQPLSGKLGGDRIRKIKFTAPLSILLNPKERALLSKFSFLRLPKQNQINQQKRFTNSGPLFCCKWALT